MKTKFFMFFALILPFAGCDLLKDANNIPIETELTAVLPVEVVSSVKKSLNQAGGTNAFTFTKSQDLSLSSNADIEPYLSKIKEITLNSLLVTINGLTSGQTITSISLDVTGVGNIFTQTDISMSNNSFTPALTTEKLAQVATKLTSDKKITLTVSGSANGAMTFTASLNFDTTIIAKAL